MLPTQMGPYRVVRKIGEGGMGAVFEGVDPEGLRAAIKLLPRGLAQQHGFLERFELEIEALRLLDHPNIVRLHGFGEQDGQLYYAMELVLGVSLGAKLAAGHQFPWREAAHITISLCAALQHAHDRGIVHRDLKPENVMLTNDGQVKLADFGIARLWGVSGLTNPGGLVGTLNYMSPEQAEGKPANTRSDMYSLGMTLYALLAGRPPFVTESLQQMLQMQKHAEPVSVRVFAPQTPKTLDQLLTRLLAKDPEKRIARPDAVARRLEDLLQGAPGTGVLPASLQPPARTLPKTPATQPQHPPTSQSPSQPPSQPNQPQPPPQLPEAATYSGIAPTQAGNLATPKPAPLPPTPAPPPEPLADSSEFEIIDPDEPATHAGLPPKPRPAGPGAPPPPAPTPPPPKPRPSGPGTLPPTPAPSDSPTLASPTSPRRDAPEDRQAPTLLAPHRSEANRPSRPVPPSLPQSPGPSGLGLPPTKHQHPHPQNTPPNPTVIPGAYTTAEEAREHDQRLAAEARRAAGRTIYISPQLILVALASAIGLAWLYFLLRPPPADVLYDQLMRVRDKGSIAEVLAAEPHVRDFIRLYPDDKRRPDVEALGDEAELADYQRLLERGSILRNPSPEEAAVELAFLDALRRLRNDPEQGVAALRDLLHMYADYQTKNSRRIDRCLRLAQLAHDRTLAQVRASQVQQLTGIVRQIERARLLADKQPAQARLILESLISLYAGRRWALSRLAEARSILATLPEDNPPPNSSPDSAQAPTPP